MPKDNPELYKELYSMGKAMIEKGQALMSSMQSMGYGDNMEMPEEFNLGNDPEKTIKEYDPSKVTIDKLKNPEKEARKAAVIIRLKKKMSKEEDE